MGEGSSTVGRPLTNLGLGMEWCWAALAKSSSPNRSHRAHAGAASAAVAEALKTGFFRSVTWLTIEIPCVLKNRGWHSEA